ncbi:shikimate dehydrogenase [Amnibacterium kyonggiense]|uniref:shikimate dehydrogenase n=1 Tax=Amnibacterium kyonggiense TaxID=595671 RepID=UPI001060BA9E|nr:shikimate dehydrogenase [Amnibacterium kyonggiense]
MTARLAVLGSPIAHSRSPLLHAAAAEVLGLEWDYGRIEATAETLPGILDGLGPEWVGLSLTMPLKRTVLPLVPTHSPLVDRLGLANTLRLGERPHLANTDVGGVEAVLRASAGVRRAVVLGAGATAASALEALGRLGVAERVVAARRPELAAQELGALADAVVPLRDADLAAADLVVSTIPGHAEAEVPMPASVAGTPLLDVAYDPWPTPLGARWTAAGGVLLHGLDMLIEQAVLQVRVFTDADPDEPLPREDEVRAAMRTAVGR